MKTLFKDPYWNILEIFYKNNNAPVHLREISRKIRLKEGPLSRHLNRLVKEKVLISENEANLRKFRINRLKIPEIFSVFDIQRYQNLPFIRKNAIDHYIKHLKEKPVFVVLFGSTAKGNFREGSDIDLIVVFNRKTDTKKAVEYAGAQTGIKISEFKMEFNDFIDEIKLKQDPVIQSGIETGFPVYNCLFYHGAFNDGL